jgi:hypothetical protein
LKGGTQGLVDARHRSLRTSAVLITALDVFYFFGCYLSANLGGKPVWLFPGLAGSGAGAITPVLLRYVVLGYAIVSLPMVLHGRGLALSIHIPRGKRTTTSLLVEPIESAYFHYRRTYRMVFGILSLVNLFGAAYFVAYGEFWLLLLVSCIGFLAKLVVFPGLRGFNRWMWRVLDTVRDSPAT